MFGAQDANPFLGAWKRRQKLAFNVFLAVLLLVGVGAFLIRQYSATAVVAMNPYANLSSDGQPRSPAEIAWTALTDQKIVSLISQFQLDNGIVQLLGQNQSFIYLRSKISLHEIEAPGSPSPEIAVSFTGQSRSTAIGVANAITGILAQVEAPGGSRPSPRPSPRTAATSPDGKIEKPGVAPEMPAQSQSDLQALQQEMQGLLKTKAQLQAAQQADMTQLAQLMRENERITRAAAHVRAQALPAADPARTALVERIKNVQAQLAELRQRYTEQYPDVQDAKATLARLQAQLERMPPEKPRQTPARVPSPNAEEHNIAMQEAQLRASLQGLEQSLQDNQNRIAVLRRRIASFNTSATSAQSAAAGQQQAQPPIAASAPSPARANMQMAPLFLVIQSATTAEAVGLPTRPVFWLLGLLAAVLLALLVVFLAEQVSPTVIEEDVSPRSLHHRV